MADHTTRDDFPDTLPTPSSDRMPEIVTRYAEDLGALRRRYPNAGSPARAARLERFLNAWEEAVDALDTTGWSAADRADRILLRGAVAADRAAEAKTARTRARLAEHLPAAQTVLALDDDRRDHLRLDPSSAARALQTAVRATEAARSRRDGLSDPDSLRLAEALEATRDVLERWWAFHRGYDPLATWWCAAPVADLTRALGDDAAALRERLGTRLVGEPVGEAAIREGLARHRVDHDADALIAAAKRERDWCLAELDRAARDMGCDHWRTALERVKDSHVAPGEQPTLVRDLAREAEAYVAAHDLLDVPDLAAETWRMEMMSPEAQKVNPFFLGGESIVVSFPTDAMDDERKRMSLRGNNPAFARATVHHELIPGHHLQQFFERRHRPYRRLFRTPFWIEGWTLHWEMLLWDRAFPRTPEERIGMLFWRLHRCVRVVFSLAYHRGEMTPEACVALLVEQCGHEPDNAEAEVRRSIGDAYDPLYQCAYLIGGLQVRALHRERRAVGDSDRAFHNRFLRENQMPIGVLRALWDSPSDDAAFAAPWRFLDL